MRTDIYDWLLAQLKDPALIERVQARRREQKLAPTGAGGAGLSEGKQTPKAAGDARAAEKLETPALGRLAHTKAYRAAWIRRLEEALHSPLSFFLESLSPETPARARALDDALDPEEKEMARLGRLHIAQESLALYGDLATYANLLLYQSYEPAERAATEADAEFAGRFLRDRDLFLLIRYSDQQVRARLCALRPAGLSPDAELGAVTPGPKLVDQAVPDRSKPFPHPARPLHGLSYPFSEQDEAKLTLLAKALLEELAPPGPNELLALGYTKEGLRKTWWDPKGLIQGAYPFRSLDLSRLDGVTARSSFVWAHPAIAQRIVVLFGQLLDDMEEAMNRTPVHWRSLAMRDYLTRSLAGERVPDPEKPCDLLTALLRLCESRVRAALGGLPRLQVSSDWALINQRLPKPLRDQVTLSLNAHPIAPLTVQELVPLLRQTRYGKRMADCWLTQGVEGGRRAPGTGGERPMPDTQPPSASVSKGRRRAQAAEGALADRARKLLDALTPEEAERLLKSWNKQVKDPALLHLSHFLFLANKQKRQAAWTASDQAKMRVLAHPSRQGLLQELLRLAGSGHFRQDDLRQGDSGRADLRWGNPRLAAPRRADLRQGEPLSAMLGRLEAEPQLLTDAEKTVLRSLLAASEGEQRIGRAATPPGEEMAGREAASPAGAGDGRALARPAGAGDGRMANPPKWATFLLQLGPLLARPTRKQIRLNRQKIADSKQTLAKTVHLVQTFVGDEPVQPAAARGELDSEPKMDPPAPDQNPRSEKPNEEAGPQLSLPARGLLARLSKASESGPTRAELEAVGQAHSPSLDQLISEINDFCFDLLDTQLILEQEGRLWADPDDLNWICNELSIDHEQS